MSAARRCREFQRQILDSLKKESYSKLLTLSVSERIADTPDIPGWSVYLLRRPGEHGGVRIAVEARKRSWLVFMAISTSSFEMLPDGTVIDEQVVIDD